MTTPNESAPAGDYVLVPREMTAAMAVAMKSRLGYPESSPQDTWAATLAAAPVRATGGELRERLTRQQVIDLWMQTDADHLGLFDHLQRFAAALSPAIAPAEVIGPNDPMPKDWCTLAVGDRSGRLFVHGHYDAIKICQAALLARNEAAIAPAGVDDAMVERARWARMQCIADLSADHEAGRITDEQKQRHAMRAALNAALSHAAPQDGAIPISAEHRAYMADRCQHGYKQAEACIACDRAPQDVEADQPTVIINHVPMPRPPADVLKQVAADMEADQPVGEGFSRRTLYDQRDAVYRAAERAGPQLYVALKNLLEAVEERPDDMGIESVTLADARAALLAAQEVAK